MSAVASRDTLDDAECLESAAEAARDRRSWKAHCLRFIPLFMCAFVPAAVHLMFGLDDVGLVEEWGVLHRFDQVGPVFWTPLDRPLLASQGIRPLTVAPHSLAYVLDPDSFRWYHLIQAVSLSLKALAMWALLGQLRFHRATCFAGGITFALFPAWDSLFTFRTIHIQVAMAAVVAAMALLLAFAERPTWTRGLAMMSALALSVLHYEAVYSIIALAPVLLFARPRLARSHLLAVLGAWYLIPFLNGLRILRLLGSDVPLYQEMIITDLPRDPISEFRNLTTMVLRGGTTSWVDPPFGWGVNAWSIFFGAAVVATFVVAVLDPLAIRRSTATGVEKPEDGGRSEVPDSTARAVGPRPRSLSVMMAASLVLATPVALVFWVQPAHLADPLRVFSVASIPLTLAVLSLLELTRRARWMSVSLIFGGAILVSVMMSAVGQRTEWNERSTTEERALGAVFAAVPDPADLVGLVILDPEQVFGGLHSFLPELLQIATDFVVPGGPQSVALCQQPAESIASTVATVPPSATLCVMNGTVVSTALASVDLRSATVVEVRRAADGAGWALDPTPTRVARISSMFDCVASGTCDEGPFGVQARVIELEINP